MPVANRFTNIQAAEYNPMSLQELLLVPSHKRQQHNAIDENIATTQTALAQVDPLAVHSDLAKQEQDRLKAQLDQQAQSLLSDGFTQTAKSDFTRLNQDYQNSVSPTGQLGKIQEAKKVLNNNKATYINNSIKAGVPPDAAALNWEEFQQDYINNFDGQNVTNIGERYSPEIIDVEAKLISLFKEANTTKNGFDNIGSTIVQDDKGNYVVNTTNKEVTDTNATQLQAAADYINNALKNENSREYKSLIEQRYDPEQYLQQLQGLKDVFLKDSKVTGSGSNKTNYTPNKTGQIGANGEYTNFIKDHVRGYNINKNLAENSPLISLDSLDPNNITFKDGNIVDGDNIYDNYEDMVNAEYPKDQYVTRFNKNTGLSESKPINARTGETYGNWETIKKNGAHYKGDLDKVRQSNPLFAKLNDQELITKLNDYKTNISEYYTQSIDLVGSNYDWLDDHLFGKDGKGGGVFETTNSVIDGDELEVNEVYEKLGYKNNQDMIDNKANPSIKGYSPILGKWRVQIKDSEGDNRTVFVEADESLKRRSSTLMQIGDSLLKGEAFSKLGKKVTPDGKEVQAYMINNFDGNPTIIYSTDLNAENINDVIEVNQNFPEDNLKYKIPVIQVSDLKTFTSTVNNSLSLNPLFNKFADIKLK